MSHSDSSDTWSDSVMSYYSTESSSQNTLALGRYPHRLMELITEQFRRMKCLKRKSQEPASEASMTEEDMGEYSGNTLRPKRLASLLKVKLEQLREDRIAEELENSEEEMIQEMPTYSDAQSASMYDETDGVRSGSRVPRSSSAAAKLYQNPNENIHVRCAKVGLTKKPSVNMQLNSQAYQAVKREIFRDSGKPYQQASQSFLAEDVYASCLFRSSKEINTEVGLGNSGRITFTIGDGDYEMANDAGPSQPLEVMCVDPSEEKQSMRHYIDLPKDDKEDNRSRFVKWTDDTKENDGDRDGRRYGKRKMKMRK